MLDIQAVKWQSIYKLFLYIVHDLQLTWQYLKNPEKASCIIIFWWSYNGVWQTSRNFWINRTLSLPAAIRQFFLGSDLIGGTDSETLKGQILKFFGHSVCNYTVSFCMWCMCLTKYRKIPQMFSAVTGQEEKCTLSSSFLPLSPRSLPCLGLSVKCHCYWVCSTDAVLP